LLMRVNHLKAEAKLCSKCVTFTTGIDYETT